MEISERGEYEGPTLTLITERGGCEGRLTAAGRPRLGLGLGLGLEEVFVFDLGLGLEKRNCLIKTGVLCRKGCR